MSTIWTVSLGTIGDVKIVIIVDPEVGPLNADIVDTPDAINPGKNNDENIMMHKTCVMETISLGDNTSIFHTFFSIKITILVFTLGHSDGRE